MKFKGVREIQRGRYYFLDPVALIVTLAPSGDAG